MLNYQRVSYFQRNSLWSSRPTLRRRKVETQGPRNQRVRRVLCWFLFGAPRIQSTFVVLFFNFLNANFCCSAVWSGEFRINNLIMAPYVLISTDRKAERKEAMKALPQRIRTARPFISTAQLTIVWNSLVGCTEIAVARGSGTPFLR